VGQRGGVVAAAGFVEVRPPEQDTALPVVAEALGCGDDRAALGGADCCALQRVLGAVLDHQPDLVPGCKQCAEFGLRDALRGVVAARVADAADTLRDAAQRGRGYLRVTEGEVNDDAHKRPPHTVYMCSTRCSHAHVRKNANTRWTIDHCQIVCPGTTSNHRHVGSESVYCGWL